jgi:hypothetical protein
LTNISNLLEIDLPHAVLIGGGVIGSVFVATGIIKEADKWSFAMLLVVIGVTIEAIFTIALFIYDEGISHEQQAIIRYQNDKIITLETRLAPRSFSAEQQREISAKLKPFAGQHFSGQVASSVPDAWPLWLLLEAALRGAGWIRDPPMGLTTGDPPAGIPVAPNEGVVIFVPKDDIPSIGPAADALSIELRKVGVAAAVFHDIGAQTRAKIMVIEIGMKPQ